MKINKNNFFLNWSFFVLFTIPFLRYFRGSCGTFCQIAKSSVVLSGYSLGSLVGFSWYSALRGRGTFGTPPYGVRGSQIPQRVLWYFVSTWGKVPTTGFAKSGRVQKKLQQTFSESLFNNYSKIPRKPFSKNPFKFILIIHPELFSEINSIKFRRFFSGMFFRNSQNVRHEKYSAVSTGA